jgi:type VI secretion system protein ImpA
MSRIDVDSLLQEVSGDLPCGENLEYDADFGEMERAARGKPEQTIGDTTVPAEDPDWAEVQSRAIQLLSRTKDLRVVLYLLRAQLKTEGLIGLNDGLNLLRAVLERYWDTVHPQLDPDDDNDPTLRVNTLLTLSDADTILRNLREAPLATSRTFGSICYRDIAMVNGEIAPSGDGETAAPDASAIHGAFMDCDLEQLQATAEAAREAIDRTAAIEQDVTNQVGAAAAPSLSGLGGSLKSIERALTEKLAGRGVGDPAAMENGEAAAEGQGSATGAPAASGQINSREDVQRALDRICEYYDRHEPSSPVPLLLRRAKRLVAKSFMEILRDMVPDGVSEAERIGGSDSD